MKTIKNATLYTALGAMLRGQPAWATVTFVGDDWSTGSYWRTPTVVKTNDIDGDNVYGSEGYCLPAGTRADGSGGGPLNPFLTVTNIITGNPWEINTLPGYISDLRYTDPLERGQSWGGAFGLQSEGVLDLVPGGFTGEVGAGILPGDLTTNTLYLTLQRSNSPNFRLTLIFGNQPNAAGYHGDPMGPDDGTGMNVTMDDGSGAVGPEASGDASLATNTVGYATYQSWDISAGSSDISITISPVDYGIPRLSALAVDSLPVASPAILVQPVGVTNFTGLPVSLSVTAVGSGLSYQWQQNSTNLSGQTSWALALVNTTTNNSGAYQVMVSNSVNSITSTPVAVAVLPLPVVTIYQNLFTGTGPLNGRTPDTAGTNNAWVAGSFWSTDGTEGVHALQSDSDANSQHAFLPFVPIPGRIYTLSAYVADTGGDEWLALGYVESTNVISGAGWHETSDNPVGWILAGVPGPSADYQDFGGPGTGGHHDGSIPNPAYSTLSVILDTRPVIPGDWTFTWLVNGSVVDGPHFVGSGPAITGVRVSAQYGAGGIVSNFTLVEQYPPSVPYLVTQPLGGTSYPGQAVTLSAAAGGSDPLTYQWQVNSNRIADATNQNLVLPDLVLTNSGAYRLIVSNPLGSTTSSVAMLVVTSPPTTVNLSSNLVLHLKFDQDFPGLFRPGQRIPHSVGASIVPAIGMIGPGAFSMAIMARPMTLDTPRWANRPTCSLATP